MAECVKRMPEPILSHLFSYGNQRRTYRDFS